MIGWGVIPSLSAYETLMEAYASHMDIAPAQAVLDRIQAVGHHPVLRTYNRLLHGISLNGDLSAAIRVYNRMKLQGLQPDLQTMRCLFKCVRMYANNVRVATARALALDKAGDRWVPCSVTLTASATFIVSGGVCGPLERCSTSVSPVTMQPCTLIKPNVLAVNKAIQSCKHRFRSLRAAIVCWLGLAGRSSCRG